MKQSIRHAVALALACLLAACGGGSNKPTEPTSPTAQPAAVVRSDFVLLEGCVTDPHARPVAASVQALAGDGRLLASGHSHDDGVFALRVPARSTVQVVVEGRGQDALELLTGSTSLSLTGCLTASA